jgi:serine/threonine protein kinase
MKSLIIDNRFVAQTEIKQGAFGIVFQGLDTTTKTKIAIKQEKGKKTHSASSLANESKILAKLKDVRGIPKLFYFGKTGEFRTLVLEFLGIFQEGKFNMREFL